jgi:endonuclease/exonuclease/phosphatase family metal-dependent hydrolase
LPAAPVTLSDAVRLVCWNLEWCPLPSGRSKRGRVAQRVITEQMPDVACLTESRLDWLDGWDGAIVSSEPLDTAHHMHRHDGRKVVLWSRSGWRDVDAVGSEDIRDLRRVVAGTTDTPFGPVRFVGVVIPYRNSNVNHGPRAVWEDHRRYLVSLAKILDSTTLPTVVVGDFNQRHPFDPSYIVPEDLHAELTKALQGLRIVTAGTVAGIDGRLIDHVAITPELEAANVTAWPAMQANVTVSDHPGFRVDLRARAVVDETHWPGPSPADVP